MRVVCAAVARFIPSKNPITTRKRCDLGTASLLTSTRFGPQDCAYLRPRGYTTTSQVAITLTGKYALIGSLKWRFTFPCTALIRRLTVLCPSSYRRHFVSKRQDSVSINSRSCVPESFLVECSQGIPPSVQTLDRSHRLDKPRSKSASCP